MCDVVQQRCPEDLVWLLIDEAPGQTPARRDGTHAHQFDWLSDLFAAVRCSTMKEVTDLPE